MPTSERTTSLANGDHPADCGVIPMHRSIFCIVVTARNNGVLRPTATVPYHIGSDCRIHALRVLLRPLFSSEAQRALGE